MPRSGQGWRRNYTCKRSSRRKKHNKPVHHGVSRFTDGDDYNAGNPTKIDRRTWQDQAGMFKYQLAFHHGWNIDGRKGLAKNIAGDLLCGWPISKIDRRTWQDQAGMFKYQLAFHHGWNIDGRKGLAKNIAGDLLCGWHSS